MFKMCYSVSASCGNPIAPKSVSAFYGAAKIDKLFELQKVGVKLFDKFRRLVPFERPVVSGKLVMSVAREVHA